MWFKLRIFFSVSVKLSVSIFSFSFSVFFVIVIVNRIKFCPLTVRIRYHLNHTIATVCVTVDIIQMNCTTRAVPAKTESFITYAYICIVCAYTCIPLCCVHSILLYNDSDGCTAKTEIIFIHFQFLIVQFLFCYPFFQFVYISVIIIVDGVKFYQLTEWIHFHYY